MEVVLAVALALFGLVVPSNAEQGYVVVPCAVSEAGRITVRDNCGFLPVASVAGAQPIPGPYIGGSAD